MMPLILGGIANMIFTKTSFYQKYKKPIDNNKLWKDGKRIFGDNKTWIGLFSMIVFCVIFQIVFGLVCNNFGLNNYNDLYNTKENTIQLNVIFGFLIGVVYMVSELPNSFIKRRLDIASGKTDKGIKGIMFFIIDQIDSLIGVMLVLYFMSDIYFSTYVLYVFGGGLIHILINVILYFTKVRRNI